MRKPGIGLKSVDTFFYIGGYRIVNMIPITKRGFVVSPLCSACALRGPEKGNLTFHRYVILDAKRQQDGLVKVVSDVGCERIHKEKVQGVKVFIFTFL